MPLARIQSGGPRRRLRGAAAAVPLVLCALAGCGGGEEAGRARDGRVAIVLDDFSIRPQTIRARAGEVRFDLENRGRIGHNFHLRRGAGDPLEVTTIFPGERKSATAELVRGDYRMVCTVSNHEELGMYGTLVVR
jgi:plastocyanin